MKPTCEPISAKQILNPVKSPSMPFDWSINPYRGCQHGCSFCYARSTHTFLGLDTDDTFQRHILFKQNAAAALESQLSRMLRQKRGRSRIGKVAIGTATDPYQPLEKNEQITRQCLEVLAAYQIPASITTRSPLILRDADLLRKIPDCSVNVSINTLDKKVWRSFEPMSPAPEQRLNTVRSLREHGVDAGVFLAPMLPWITDGAEQLEPLVGRIAHSGASFVMGSVLRLNTAAVKSWFFRSLHVHYAPLVSRYARLYAGSTSTPKSYRKQVMDRLDGLLQAYGLASYQPFGEKDRGASFDNSESTEQRPVQLVFDI